MPTFARIIVGLSAPFIVAAALIAVATYLNRIRG